MKLSRKLEVKLNDLFSNVWADRSEVELIRLQAETGQMTEAQAIRRLGDYERRLMYGQSSPAVDVVPEGKPSIWKSEELRVFISHRGAHRLAAHRLSAALEPYGISCFVAHHAIEPTEAWRDAIAAGLRTMHALVALVTDDFQESPWTMQEVGFGLGRSVLCVGLMVGTRKPPGLLEASMALRIDLADLPAGAAKLAALLVRRSRRRAYVIERLISDFLEAGNATQAHDRLGVLIAVADRLEENEVERLVGGVNANDHLRRALSKASKSRQQLLTLLKAKARGAFEWRDDQIFATPAAERS